MPLDELQQVAEIGDWPRRVRELRSVGWDIEYLTSARAYRLRSKDQNARHIQTGGIGLKQRYRVITRDHSKCRRCGAAVEDGVKLVVDHIIPRDWGGGNDDTNLWTLCEPCNLGKKAWQSDIDAGTMTKVLQEPSGRGRLRRFFEVRAGQIVTKEELQIVAGIADYARRIRELRQEGRFNILSHYEDSKLKPGQYRYIPRGEL